MLIKIALNGGKKNAPSTIEEIAEDIAACAAAGATAFHVHPRDAHGNESLEASAVDPLVAAIRARAPGIRLGLTTAAWILPDHRKRLDAIAQWQQLPDFASVNFDEEGCVEISRLLIGRSVAVEAGLLDRETTVRFLDANLPVERVLIEIQEQRLNDAMRAIDIIVDTLGDHAAPRLLHGHDAVTWDLLDEAVRRGYDSRVGLEDVATLPDGSAATNVSLFKAALRRAERGPLARE